MVHVRLSPVAIACALLCLPGFPQGTRAEEVTDVLKEAHEQYEQSLEEIEREAVARLDELINQYADDGNLKKVLELRAQKMKLLEDRNWPESVLLRSMRAKIRSSRVRARRELANAYEDAIATLTKERKYDDAVALRGELEELVEIQEEFDFRSEEPERKKTADDADAIATDDQSPAKSPIKAKAARPAPAQKRVVGKASSSSLAATLAAEAARTPLANPLATSSQKQDALNNLVEAFYRSLPPQQWTPSQLEDFTDFLTAMAPKADGSVLLPELGSSKSPVGTIPSAWARGDEIKGYPGMQWLVSSPTPDEFISRATHLGTREYWLAVDKASGPDNLKVWFKSIGCNDAKSVAVLIGKFRTEGVRLSALTVIDKEVGSASAGNNAPASIKKESPNTTLAHKPDTGEVRAGSTSVAKQAADVTKPPEPSQELGALLANGPERSVLSDRLASRTEKVIAVQDLLRRVSRGYPLSKWTYEDSVYLSSIAVDVQADTSFVPVPNTPRVGRAGMEWGCSHATVDDMDGWFHQGIDGKKVPGREYVRNRFLALWLASAPDPTELIRRTQVLRDKKALPSVSSTFSEDDLKVWLAACGCTTRESVTEVIDQLLEAGAPLAVVEQFASREGL